MDGEDTLADRMEGGDASPPPSDGDTQDFLDAYLVELLRFAAILRPTTAANGRLLFVVDVGAGGAYGGVGGFGGVPASGKAIAGLPETKAGEGEAREEQCAVCLEGYEAGDALRTMPCSHGFHAGCILKWLAVSRLCPLCRFALPGAVENMEEDDGEEDVDDDDEPCASPSSPSS
ncbi:hypothetical protein ACP4OV_003254 [Aristida adscensionis]